MPSLFRIGKSKKQGKRKRGLQTNLQKIRDLAPKGATKEPKWNLPSIKDITSPKRIKF